MGVEFPFYATEGGSDVSVVVPILTTEPVEERDDDREPARDNGHDGRTVHNVRRFARRTGSIRGRLQSTRFP